MTTLKPITLTLAVLAALLLAGCAVTDAASDRIGERAADVVHDDCEHSADEDREALRARMDSRTAPHLVRVECAEEEQAQ